jgi:hypothetical protein
MTDRTQFEAMLEALINEDQETAQEIFHNIVVAKSREIYEELLSEDFDLEEGENPFADKDSEEEPADDSEESDDEADDSEESDDVGGDATDDFIDDVTDGEEEEGGESEEGDDDQEARIMDLEDALEELKAEFEQLMADEGNEPDMGGDMDAMGAPDMGGDMDAMGAPDMGGEQDELERMMEYTQKVALPKHGDNGANTKSIVAKPNNMGGTTANIAKSFSTTSGGTQGGLANPSTKEENFGNINVPGGKAGKTAFKKSEPGHGPEKKGSREQADNKKSIVGSK